MGLQEQTAGGQGTAANVGVPCGTPILELEGSRSIQLSYRDAREVYHVRAALKLRQVD